MKTFAEIQKEKSGIELFGENAYAHLQEMKSSGILDCADDEPVWRELSLAEEAALAAKTPEQIHEEFEELFVFDLDADS